MNKDNTIFVTLNKLVDFAKFATDWNDIANDCDADPMADCEFEGTYPLSLEDVKEALEYARDYRITNDKFLMGWWFPLVLKCDEALLIRDIFTNVPTPNGKIEPPLPMTDDDMLVYVLNVIADYSNSENARISDQPVTEFFDIDLLLNEIEMFEEDNDQPVENRQFSERMRENFIMQLDNDILLRDSDEGTRNIWRKFTDELAELGNFNAMRIKAYACYGGNCCYDCNWHESARLLDILWREYSFGQAANTLGYIYYYGRLDPKGKPDYEKAFFYFSIGSTYGIIESKYKLADMFVNGYYVARNEKLARDIIGELYGETKFRFESGDYACDFADIAFRMGKLFRDISNYELDPVSRKGALEVSKIYLLQAKFAIDLRMEYDCAFGDEKVKDNIERILDEVSSRQPKAEGTIYHSYNPVFVSIFTDNKPGALYDVSVRQYKNGNIRFRLDRHLYSSKYPHPMSLVVFPWFDECLFTEHMTFTLSCVAGFDAYDESGRNVDWVEKVFTIDSVKTEELGYDDNFVMTFSREGLPVLRVSAGDIIYKRYTKK